jgi:hypothetical protein
MEFIADKIGSIISGDKKGDDDDDHVPLDDVYHERIRADSAAACESHSDVDNMIAMIEGRKGSIATDEDPAAGFEVVPDVNLKDDDDGLAAGTRRGHDDENADDDDAADASDALARLPKDVRLQQAQEAGPDVEPEDEESLNILANWLIDRVEILPSLVTKYCRLFISHGVATIRRLAKRVAREEGFLLMIGVAYDDAVEITEVLQKYVKTSA